MRRPKLKPTAHPDTKAFIPASVLLQRLHDEAPTDHFTLALQLLLALNTFGAPH
jgi:hypothetical protein